METDTNPYLIGCANGILDLEGSVFREGVVDENVTFKMGRCPDMDAIQYIPYETVSDNPIYEEIDDFFAKLFPDEVQRNYMWRLLASCLKGKNDEEKLYNWHGSGGNGKSILVELMRITFGDYAGCLSPTVLTSREGHEFNTIRNKRFIFMSERDDNEPLNHALIKQLTGQDYIMFHDLNQNPVNMKITGKIMYLCNTLNRINSCDMGTWRRLSVIPFTSRFVSEGNPQYNPEQNIFHIDQHLYEKLSRWRTYFFSKLVHLYKTEYLERWLRYVPQIMKDAHAAYMDAYHPFMKFYKSRVRKSNRTVGNNVPVRELFNVYNQWYDDEGANVGLRKLKNQDIISCMKQLVDTIMVGNQDVVHNEMVGYREIVHEVILMIGGQEFVDNVMVFNSAEEANRWDEA